MTSIVLFCFLKKGGQTAKMSIQDFDKSIIDSFQGAGLPFTE